MTEREEDLLDALKAAIFALNWIPNQALRHPDFKNTYELVAAIEKVVGPLMEEERQSSDSADREKRRERMAPWKRTPGR